MSEVISGVKISTNLERIADQSVTIARRAKRLNPRPAMGELALLEPPYHLALAIFRDSIRAFADGDCEHARTLKLKDRELDALTEDVTTDSRRGLSTTQTGRLRFVWLRSGNDPGFLILQIIPRLRFRAEV